MRAPAGLELGRDIVKLVKTYLLAPPGQATEITLDTLPSMEADLELCSRGFLLLFPQITVNVAAGAVWDGASLSQVVSQITLSMSDKSPPSKYNHGHIILDAVDGYRAFMGLEWLSNRMVWLTRTQTSPELIPGTTNQSVNAVDFTKNQIGWGWPQYTGPFATAVGAPFAANPTLALYLPIGDRVGEKPGDVAISNRWFNGKPAGTCDSGPPGFIRLTIGSTIDGLTITWPAGGQITLYAVCRAVRRERMPIPVTPFVRTKQWSNNRFYLDQGINGLAGFCKPLLADAMQSHGTTQANLWDQNGNNLVYGQNLAVNTTCINRLLERPIFMADANETALTHAGTARNSRAIIPLIQCDGQLTDCIGDVDRGPEVEVVQSTDTTYDFLQAGWNPVTPEVRRCAEQWAGADASSPETQNGNMIGPTGVALGIDQLLPQSIAMKIAPGSIRKC